MAPPASMVAIGRLARELTADHPQQDAYGPDSPLGRLVAAGGEVLMLGAPLETLTILHHAEAIAAAPGRRTVTFEIPVATPSGVERRTYTDIDTSRGAYRYEDLDLPCEDEFTTIGTAALEAGIGTTGRVGAASCHPSRPPSWFASASTGSTVTSGSAAPEGSDPSRVAETKLRRG